MRTIASSTPLPELYVECLQVPLEAIPDGSGTARGSGVTEGWITGLKNGRVYGLDYPDLRAEYPAIDEAVTELAAIEQMTVMQVMVNRLAAHHTLNIHRDGPPAHYRWHYPVATNDGCIWWDEIDGTVTMKAGKWWGPVHYCGKLHSAANLGSTPRTHLIVDLI
jgi:hypothetical protein